ncbi:Fur family ferric uptake transcriptional regulator [Salinibacterium sp. CAN_S4]
MTFSPDIELRRAGLRITSSRVRVLSALVEQPHSSALVIHSRLGDAATSVQSVHNALAALTEAGLLRRIEPAGSAALYEIHENDNHHHLVCNSCRTVVDVECAVGHSPCLAPVDSSGFQISTAEVTFWGLCQDCASRESAHSSTPIRSSSTNQEDS